jgi:hypothetical protein
MNQGAPLFSPHRIDVVVARAHRERVRVRRVEQDRRLQWLT